MDTYLNISFLWDYDTKNWPGYIWLPIMGTKAGLPILHHGHLSINHCIDGFDAMHASFSFVGFIEKSKEGFLFLGRSQILGFSIMTI